MCGDREFLGAITAQHGTLKTYSLRDILSVDTNKCFYGVLIDQKCPHGLLQHSVGGILACMHNMGIP